MPAPKVYEATALAAVEVAVKPLDGTREAAQAYADGITTSRWWKRNCAPSWMGDRPDGAVPTRVWIDETPAVDVGGATWHRLYWFEGRRVPRLEIGHGVVNVDLRAIEDPWVILHELAHVWAAEETPGHHGRMFNEVYLRLVRQYLGEDHYTALKGWYKHLGIRANYCLI